jgi:hypothetical protein
MNPQSLSSIASASAFTTNENKALLWSVLHGGGKFIGISDKHLHSVQEMFEITIREMGEHYRRLNQSTDLNTMNKEAVVVICKKIEVLKQQSHLQPQQQQMQNNFPHQNSQIYQNSQIHQNYQKKQQQIPQLETIYRAEDLQKKEEEMSSILKLKKPEEINFTDDVYDKPIGDDMERLLAEALASRERELEQIKNVSYTTPLQTSISTSNVNQEIIHYNMVRGEKDQNGNNQNNGNVIEKRVSFGNELHIIENQNNENNNENNNVNNNENCEDISFIFNKLKKVKPKKIENDSNDCISNMNFHDNSDGRMILQLSEDVKYIKNTLTELMEKINKIYSH